MNDKVVGIICFIGGACVSILLILITNKDAFASAMTFDMISAVGSVSALVAAFAALWIANTNWSREDKRNDEHSEKRRILALWMAEEPLKQLKYFLQGSGIMLLGLIVSYERLYATYDPSIPIKEGESDAMIGWSESVKKGLIVYQSRLESIDTSLVDRHAEYFTDLNKDEVRDLLSMYSYIQKSKQLYGVILKADSMLYEIIFEILKNLDKIDKSAGGKIEDVLNMITSRGSVADVGKS